MKPRVEDLRRVAPIARTLAVAAVGLLFGFLVLNPNEMKVAANNRDRAQTLEILGAGPLVGIADANCASQPDGYSWGVVLATGDLSFTGNTVTAGLIYAPGAISHAGTVVLGGEGSGGGCQ